MNGFIIEKGGKRNAQYVIGLNTLPAERGYLRVAKWTTERDEAMIFSSESDLPERFERGKAVPVEAQMHYRVDREAETPQFEEALRLVDEKARNEWKGWFPTKQAALRYAFDAENRRLEQAGRDDEQRIAEIQQESLRRRERFRGTIRALKDLGKFAGT